MSVPDINALLLEAKDRLTALDNETLSLKNRVVIAYGEDDLLDLIKGIKSYPAVGIVYEGMRSTQESTSTERIGLSAEAIVALVLIEQGNATYAGDQRRARSIEYLRGMRDVFMTQRSVTTSHRWRFMVEAPALLKAGMVVWVQRWSVPVQLPPRPPLSQDPGPPTPLPEPEPLSTLTAIYGGTHAVIGPAGGVSMALWFDRHLQLVADESAVITLEAISSDPLWMPNVILPLDRENSTFIVTYPPSFQYGRAQLIFSLGVDLTGGLGKSFSVSDLSLREGWSHLHDDDTGRPIKDSLNGLVGIQLIVL